MCPRSVGHLSSSGPVWLRAALYGVVCDEPTHAIKASVAYVNRQILCQNFPCFVLSIPHLTLSP
jgi:hypothetical protein